MMSLLLPRKHVRRYNRTDNPEIIKEVFKFERKYIDKTGTTKQAGCDATVMVFGLALFIAVVIGAVLVGKYTNNINTMKGKLEEFTAKISKLEAELLRQKNLQGYTAKKACEKMEPLKFMVNRLAKLGATLKAQREKHKEVEKEIASFKREIHQIERERQEIC
mmetsp:Transcript_23140/g.25690  ORF Transcript_23140/g.25690 Transcript_23140/m.25690 type:complete len:163 (+) Transcript_23140:402-890(+)